MLYLPQFSTLAGTKRIPVPKSRGRRNPHLRHRHHTPGLRGISGIGTTMLPPPQPQNRPTQQKQRHIRPHLRRQLQPLHPRQAPPPTPAPAQSTPPPHSPTQPPSHPAPATSSQYESRPQPPPPAASEHRSTIFHAVFRPSREQTHDSSSAKSAYLVPSAASRNRHQIMQIQRLVQRRQPMKPIGPHRPNRQAPD